MLRMTPLTKMTLGLITPSSPLFSGRLEKMVSFFEDHGFKIKIGDHNKKTERFLAGSDTERAADIMKFFEDSEVDALVVTGGGAGSIRVLPLLDYELIKNNPKPIIGFSDTTSLQLGIYSQTMLRSFTGFTGKDVAEFERVDSLIEKTLSDCLLMRNYSVNEGVSINSGVVKGQLVGGNLTAISNLIGTPFQPNFKDKILFIEEVFCEPYVIDGLFAHLYLAGIFNQISGLIIGCFKNCDAQFYPDRDGTADDVINDWLKKIKVPCIKGFPYSHFDRRCVLPIGQLAILNATECILHIHFNNHGIINDSI
jgi:muramoyltetrapeptide carboxypeptidase